SRGTVNSVYDMLLAQSYIYTKGGSGTFICELPAGVDHEVERDNSAAQLSNWGQRVLHQFQISNVQRASDVKQGDATLNNAPTEFSLGKVELKQFPIKEWNRCLYEQARQQYELEMIDAYSSE